MHFYKKHPRKTFLVSEDDLETIEYSEEPKEDLFTSKSMLAASNKVFDFDSYKKEQAEALKDVKKQQIDDELFANESVLAAANKLFDFNKFKKEQNNKKIIK